VGNSPPAPVADLVDRFSRDRKVFQSLDYKEEQLRAEFLNPFFESLGWDVSNKAGLTEVFKPVIHEESIKIAGATKAPDYTFRIGGRRVFFAEAKKPAVRIADDSSPAFQLRRYAWTSKLPVSLLTDFEEFAVYDCRIRPFQTDKPATARTMLLGYTDYLERWDDLAGLFSPDAIQKGSLDRYVESTKTKKGTAAVDDAFLAEIEKWRDSLARNIALRNPGLTTRHLNFAVQRTIDRLIFLRICEDRGIEHYAFLQSLMNGERIYPRLVKHFRDADDRYNSGLFHFGEEKDRSEPPDPWTLSLDIDDKPLKEIIGSLYYPDCPYEFSVLPADILGQVYEQFLGKVIRLTAGHQAKVEEKPEVRKAGGVYYTPTYIVDYIVKNTVGKLVEGKTPKQVEALRILDPACGSGSFLLGAYQYLLDWHLTYYAEHKLKPKLKQSVTPSDASSSPSVTPSPSRGLARNAAAPIYQDSRGNWRLTTAERKRILLNNIYGVDIDSQAVEVTKLSLLLKVLEGENQETLQNQLKFFHERALPDLGSNIKCGNSLIGPDFYQNQQSSLFDEEEQYRINVFDWNAAFPATMKSGGFDAVIGNPPYGAASDEYTKHFLSRQYDVAVPVADSFVLFVLKAVSLLDSRGIQGFIVPSTWLYMPMYADFRRRLLSTHDIDSVTLFRSPVFPGVTVETCVEFIRRPPRPHGTVRFVEVKGSPSSFAGAAVNLNKTRMLNTAEVSIYGTPDKSGLFDRMAQESDALGTLALTVCGLTPYRKGKGSPPQTEDVVEGRVYDADRKVDKTYRRYLMGRDFHRYRWQFEDARWISYGDWLAEPRYAAPFSDKEKIVIRQTADSIIAQLDTQQFLSLKNVHNLRVTSKGLTYRYLLGILNSSLMTWWYRQLIPEKGRVFAEVKVVNLEKLPIRTIDFSNKADKARHDKMVELVERMLDLHKQLPKAKTPHEQESLQRTIDAADQQIDALVYELYGLTECETGIVEGGKG